MAAAAGVPVSGYKLRLFVLSAGLAGLAGGLFTFHLQFLSPDAFDVFLSIQFVVMVAVGGFGSIFGAVLGAVAITWLEHELRAAGDARDAARLRPARAGAHRVLRGRRSPRS